MQLTPMQSFIRHLLDEVLMKRTRDKVLKLLRKLHWEDPEVSRERSLCNGVFATFSQLEPHRSTTLSSLPLQMYGKSSLVIFLSSPISFLIFNDGTLNSALRSSTRFWKTFELTWRKTSSSSIREESRQ